MEPTGGLDFSRFEALTFDCYGTLIDWEAGIVGAFRPTLGAAGAHPGDDEILETYSRIEAGLEAGPYLPYRELLARAFRSVCQAFGVEADEAASVAFGGSVRDWPAFDDSPTALARLRKRYRLGVITNCDDDLFAASNRRLGVTFDWILTAQSVGSYKPARRNFEVALATIGLPPDRILHVAQSLFHDHVPARALGLTTAWVDRRHDRPGFGATPPVEAAPDATYPDLASLADAATAE